MKKYNTLLTMLGLILVLLFAISSCSVNDDESSADDSESEQAESKSEFAESAGSQMDESGSEEHSSEESGNEEHANEEHANEESGEESGTQYAKTETYDDTRNGARLVISFDAETQAFTGTVENTTDETLKQVRVEVHLSNGTELGPTEPGDLEPGASMDVTLAAVGEEFTTWEAHPEVGGPGSGEHGSEENHD